MRSDLPVWQIERVGKMKTLKQIGIALLLTSNGAFAWIMLEVWHVAPPYCSIAPADDPFTLPKGEVRRIK